MSGNTQIYQTTTPPTTSGGVLGSGYSALCAAAMGTSLVNLYQMLNIQNKLKALNIQNIQNEAEAQSIATIEAGKKDRMGMFIQAGAQLGQSASGLYTTGKNVTSEWDSQNKLGEISAGKGTNLKNMEELINGNRPGDDLIKKVRENPAGVDRIEKRFVQNYASAEQKDLIRTAAAGEADPVKKAEIEALLNPAPLENADFKKILGNDLLSEDELKTLQKQLSPKQQKAVLEQAGLFNKQELPEQQKIIRENQAESNKQTMWSQQIFGPFAQATGNAGHGIYTAEAAKDRASGQLANAAEQMARDANQTVGSTLDMITRVIEALMSAQATMAQKTA